MALNDDAVLIPGTGHIYLANPGTPEPADPKAPPAAWTSVGHTSRDEGLSITRDGGDSEVKGTWQAAALRERRDPTTWALTFTLHQVDQDTFRLYFGAGTVAAGKFGVKANATPTERALFVRMIDGADEVGLYIPRVSVFAEDDISVDVENFLSFPVRATVLEVTGSDLMTWFSAGFTTGT